MKKKDNNESKTKEKDTVIANRYLTKEEIALAKQLSTDLRDSNPSSRTPELLYLGFLKNIKHREGLEPDLLELKKMIYSVAQKMAEIEEKSLSKYGNNNKRYFAQFKAR